MRNNIPVELRQLPQWVVANDDKVPHDPKTNKPASVTDPATWGSYEQATSNKFFKHVGFVLTKAAGFTIIDLDDKPERPISDEVRARHNAILEHFQSYTERSTSRRGYHIIVQGLIPAGVHRDSIEMYSEGRYMICTGDVVKNLPISNAYQASLENMYGQMKPEDRVALTDGESHLEDMELVEMAMAASNGDKFNSLCSGEMSEYPSQSEADLALLSIIAFYTRDNEQVRRIFRMSALGKREKALKNDTYLNYALGKIRAKEAPPVDASQLVTNAAAAVASMEQSQTTDLTPKQVMPELPPGLMGEIATYIFQAAVRPVPEVALAASIALMAGLCQRQYNTTTDSGLNHYIILLAGTGRGKEGARAGIDKLLQSIRLRIPSIEMFRGPAAYSSGPAVIKSLGKNPCLLSVLGEFGLTLQHISDPKANGADKTLMRVLLDLYGQSGYSRTLGMHKYSQTEKDAESVRAPNLTILGETTPETFFDGLSEDMVATGLIPRFLTIEYNGDRPYINPNANFAPPQTLVDQLANLAENVLRMQANDACMAVQLDPSSVKAADAYDRWTTDQINHSNGAVVELWNRAHLKVVKLASLVAVGVNPSHPVVTIEHFNWARNLVEKDIQTMTRRFETNDIGSGDGKQLKEMERIIRRYLTLPDAKSFQGYEQRCFDHKLIPKSWIQRRCANLAVFKNDKQGSTSAMNRTLQTMVENDRLREVGKTDPMLARIGVSMKVYCLGANW